jgi:hypothetical protein
LYPGLALDENLTLISISKKVTMFFSIALLIVIVFLAFKIAPVEKKEHAAIHGAGQIGLLAALALFGVDYFTSYFYATGEMMSALQPYNLQKYAFIAVVVISIANAVFGILYMYSLGVFNEGGGSYTAAMRYLAPGLSLVVAVVLLQDYIFTIVVSSLSGVDQLLSLKSLYGIPWYYHVGLGIALVTITWYLTIRGRGESSRVVFTMLGIFVLLTIAMAIGLFLAKGNGVAALPYTQTAATPSIGTAMYHMLTASMKGLVALSGLEAMSNGIQFVVNEDFGLVKWGKEKMPQWKGLWDFYSGKSGIGRMVQTSFLFYGGLTTAFLTYFAIHFNAFDATEGRSLVANLSFIGFSQIPGGIILYWAYQILAVGLLAAASMTAFQDLQATEWHFHPFGDDRFCHRYHHYIPYTGTNCAWHSVLWNWRVHADHDDGLCHSPPYLKYVPEGYQTRLGGFWRRVCRHIVRAGFCRSNSRQMDGRRLGGIDLLQHPDSDGQPCPYLADRIPGTQANLPDRAPKGARSGCHGFDCGMAVPAHAGISIQCDRLDCTVLRNAWRSPTNALRAAHPGRRL